jgi:hypothetical protein
VDRPMIGPITALFWFSIRQTLLHRRIWLILLLLAAPAALNLLIRYVEPDRRLQEVWLRYHGSMQFLMFMVVIPLVCMLYGTALLGAEAESGTLVYLLTRRPRRATVLLVRFVATALVLALLLEAAVGALHLCALAGVDLQSLPSVSRRWPRGWQWQPVPELTAYLYVVPLGLLSYLAVFTLIGLAARRPIRASIIYLAVIDLAVGSLPIGARMYTVSDQLRRTMLHAIPRLARLYNLPAELQTLLYPPGSTGTGVLLFVAVAALALSCVLVTVRELTPAQLARE